MSRLVVLYIFVAGLSLCSSLDKSKAVFCNVNYPDFISCVRKEGNTILYNAFDKCKDEFKVNTTDAEFGKEACNNNDTRRKFLSCLNYEKKKNNSCANAPESCYKKTGIEIQSSGHGTLGYFCAKKERFCCIKKKAPKDHLKAMQKCLKKVYNEPKKFLSTICKKGDMEAAANKVAEWKVCYFEEIHLDKDNCAPSYIKECKDSTESC